MFDHTIKAVNDEDSSQPYQYYFFTSPEASPSAEEIVNVYEDNYFDGYDTIHCGEHTIAMLTADLDHLGSMVAPSDVYPDMGWYVL